MQVCMSCTNCMQYLQYYGTLSYSMDCQKHVTESLHLNHNLEGCFFKRSIWTQTLAMLGRLNSSVGMFMLNRGPIMRAIENIHCLLNKNKGRFGKFTQIWTIEDSISDLKLGDHRKTLIGKDSTNKNSFSY